MTCAGLPMLLYTPRKCRFASSKLVWHGSLERDGEVEGGGRREVFWGRWSVGSRCSWGQVDRKEEGLDLALIHDTNSIPDQHQTAQMLVVQLWKAPLGLQWLSLGVRRNHLPWLWLSRLAHEHCAGFSAGTLACLFQSKLGLGYQYHESSQEKVRGCPRFMS